jgi:O-antigen ligase
MIRPFPFLFKAADRGFNALAFGTDAGFPMPEAHVRRDEVAILCLVAAVFTSAVLSVAVLAAILALLAWQKRLAAIVQSVPESRCLLACSLTTLAVSLARWNLTGIATAFVLCAVFVVSLYIRSVMTRALFEKIIDVACWASLPGFAVIVAQRMATIREPLFRASSLFLNANYYGAVTALMILLCIYKMIQPEQRHWKFYLSILLVNAAGLNISDCRSAMAALGVSILVMLWLYKRFRDMGIMAFLVVLNGVLIRLVPWLTLRIGHVGMDFAYRLSIWKTAARGILLHPFFGQGGGTYRLIFARFGGPDEWHAHSLFLDPLLNFGIVGVMLLAVYYGRNLLSIRNLSRDPADRPRYILMAAVVACVVIHGMTDITVFSVQTGLLVSILLGVAGIRECHPETDLRVVSMVARSAAK